MKRIYIAGPMRGLPKKNFGAFDRAEQFFKDKGFEVVNPANMDRADHDFSEEDVIVSKEQCQRYAKRDCEAIMGCTHMAMLMNWEKSTGAKAEFHLAKWLQLEILDAVTGNALREGPLLVGLCDYAQVGKSSIADLLGFPQCAFAAYLKEMATPVLKSLGLDVHRLEDKITARPILVGLGAVARSVDPLFWIKNLKIPEGSPVVVITDVRYLNEIKFIQGRGGVVFNIVRKGYGPANAEETRSFNEIFAAEKQSPVMVVNNDSSISKPVEIIKQKIEQVIRSAHDFYL